MTQGSHTHDDQEYNRSAYRNALRDRDWKHIQDEFPPATPPTSLEGYRNDSETIWTHATCPYRSPCKYCGRYECHDNQFVVAINGACRGNGTSSARGAISVYFGPNNVHNFIGLLDFDREATGQKAELSAVIKALEIVQHVRLQDLDLKGMKDLIVKTDSAYIVDCMVEKTHDCNKDDFTTIQQQPASNQDLIEYLSDLVDDLGINHGINVFFWHVMREFNQVTEKRVNATLSAGVPPPRVFIVASELERYPWFPDMYASLVDLLEERATVYHVDDIDVLDTLVEGPNTRFLLVDDGVSDPRRRRGMSSFVSAVRQRGSRVVMGGLLPNVATWTEIDSLLGSVFNVPWRIGSYTKDDLVLREKSPNYSTKGLIESQYVKALFLKNVPTAHCVYQMKHGSEAFAACTTLGQGFLGYLGAVNCETLGNRAIISMLGLPPVVDEQDFRLKTKATKVMPGYGIVFLDKSQVDF